MEYLLAGLQVLVFHCSRVSHTNTDRVLTCISVSDCTPKTNTKDEEKKDGLGGDAVLINKHVWTPLTHQHWECHGSAVAEHWTDIGVPLQNIGYAI